MQGLPPRCTHARFLEELVYDFLFPWRSKTIKVTLDADVTSNSSAVHASSFHSLSMFGQGDDSNVYHLRSVIGRQEYLRAVPMLRITKSALKGRYFVISLME
jgi:hypothetical protein